MLMVGSPDSYSGNPYFEVGNYGRCVVNNTLTVFS